MTIDSAASDVRSLVAALQEIAGSDAVSAESATLRTFGHDAWPVSVVAARRDLHPTSPDVVVSITGEDVLRDVLAVATAREIPVTARGLGSSVTGQALPVRGGIVLDLAGLVGEPELNEVDQTVTVPAGVRGSDLEAWLNGRGFTLNHIPQSLPRSSVGGWLATRATGQLSSKYGGIEHLVAGYRIVLADGESVDVYSRPRAAVGPDLRQLFLGSEGTFGVIVSVTLRVFARSGEMLRRAYLLPTVGAGLNAMRRLTQSGLRPALVRFYDERESRHALRDQGIEGCVLFLGFDGESRLATVEAEVANEVVLAEGARPMEGDPVGAWLERRFDFSAVEAYLERTGGYAETIEVAHRWSGIESLCESLRAGLLPLADEVLMHFSHVYDQGVSLYVIVFGDAHDDEAAAARLTEIWRTAMDITVAEGGELSHHHGAGLARQEYIPASLGSQHLLIRRLKDALDPVGILNPGKLGL